MIAPSDFIVPAAKRVLFGSNPLTRALVRLMAKPGPIAMLMLVRDESDVLRENIEFHRAHGVSAFVITDNGSVDGTRDILSDIARSGDVVVLDEPAHDYRQLEWTNRMLLVAAKRFNPAWVFACDADEFWYPTGGDYLAGVIGRNNLVHCPWRNMLPRPGRRWQDFDRTGHLLWYGHNITKALSARRGLHGFYVGNHDVRVVPRVEARSDNVVVYHYPVRTYAQFERKIVYGYRAAMANPTLPASSMTQLREGYAAWQQGLLPEVYARILGSSGVEDTTMRDYFASADSTSSRSAIPKRAQTSRMS